MDKKSFMDSKKGLVSLIQELMANPNVIKNEENSLIKILEILNQYTYENRLELKGLLSHTIIDSLELDYALAERLILFDNSIK